MLILDTNYGIMQRYSVEQFHYCVTIASNTTLNGTSSANTQFVLQIYPGYVMMIHAYALVPLNLYTQVHNGVN